MGHFVRIRGSGLWVPGSTILQSELEQLDANQAAAINGDGGGTWAPSALITIGGLGLTVSGEFNASDANVIDVAGSLTINSGATLQLTGNQVVNSGAVVGFTSGSFLTVQNGATLTTNSSATANLGGTTNITATGSLVTNASSSVIINGSLTVNSTLALSKGAAITQSTANTAALTATGNGTGSGATLTGGTTGPGLIAVNGTAQTNTAPTCAAQMAGYVQLTGTSPNQTVDPGANNVIHASNICHARCTVDVGTGGPYTPDSSYNIEVVDDVVTGVYRFQFKRAMADNKYTTMVNCDDAQYDVRVILKTTLVVQVSVIDATTRLVNGAPLKLDLLVFGVQ